MHQTETHVLITFKTVLKNNLKKKRYTVIKQSPSTLSLFVYSKYILIYIHILLARTHMAFQSQCYSNNIKHKKLKTRKIIN